MPKPRKPTELLELSGAFQAHPERRRPVGPKSGHGIGDPPDRMSGDEATCWYEFVHYAPAGLLTGGDRWTLEQASVLVAKSRREGLSGAERATLRTFLSELGATPAARSKVMAAPAEEKAPANPWDVPAAHAGSALAQ